MKALPCNQGFKGNRTSLYAMFVAGWVREVSGVALLAGFHSRNEVLYLHAVKRDGSWKTEDYYDRDMRNEGYGRITDGSPLTESCTGEIPHQQMSPYSLLPDP
jgi:hypothetical protein